MSAVAAAMSLYANAPEPGPISGTSFEGLNAGTYNITENGTNTTSGGEIVPVMSVRMKMGLSEDVITGASRIIILKTETGDLVGIIVDQVNQVLTLNEKDIEKVRYDDKKGQSKVSFVSGVGHYDGGLVSILDLDAVVSEKESKEKASNAS